MAKSVRDMVVPVLFLVEGAFWVVVVATGGGILLLFAAIAGIVSGLLLFSAPSYWAARPLAGASALFALALALYQFYQAATLLGSNLNTVGVTSGATFGIFALVSVYLELATLTMGRSAAAPAEA